MVQNGVDPETLRQLMGHPKLSTVFERYIKSSEEVKTRARTDYSEEFTPASQADGTKARIIRFSSPNPIKSMMSYR